MFCSSRPTGQVTAPALVDQTAERIVFEVDDGEVTAHIQIQYEGTAEEFAWIIPVGSIPTLSETDSFFFDDLDVQTRPEIQLPAWDCPAANNTQPFPSNPVDSGSSSGFGGGCGGGGSFASSAPNSDEYYEDSNYGWYDEEEGQGSTQAQNPVGIYANGSTDNYEYHVIAASGTRDLYRWLIRHGYNVSENMIPLMALYNTQYSMSDPGPVPNWEETREPLDITTARATFDTVFDPESTEIGWDETEFPGPAENYFLAIKLRAGASDNAIAPISITYEGLHPMIPIQLTAVGARPRMGIQVFILADQYYLPANYTYMTPQAQQMTFDTQGRTNYFQWVARQIEEAEGQMLIAEAFAEGFVGDRYRSLSRFYTRLSPEHMTSDPIFVPSGGAATPSPSMDFSSHRSIWGCFGDEKTELEPGACAYNYCGRNARCYVVDGQAACSCPGGTIADQVVGPDGNSEVVCVPLENPYGITAAAGGEGTEFDPCGSRDCGDGICVLKTGYATCECEEGALAVSPFGVVTCSDPTVRSGPFGSGAGTEAYVTAAANQPSRYRGLSFAGPWIPFVLAFGFLFRLNRRRNAV